MKSSNSFGGREGPQIFILGKERDYYEPHKAEVFFAFLRECDRSQVHIHPSPPVNRKQEIKSLYQMSSIIQSLI